MLRFFAGWDLPADLCQDPESIRIAYELGVPMGGDLPPGAGADGPRFFAYAEWDTGTTELPGTPLQQLQLVKGWIDAEGRSHERVVSLAGDADNGAGVELATCALIGEGHERLCAVWTDDDFDPSRPAFYYVRAVENPSCRWSTQQCIQLTEDERPAACSDPEVPKTIQERAWCSPIWYAPE